MRPIVLLTLLVFALPVRAADPSLATYSADGSRLLWLLQLTDSHIDTFLNGGEEDRLRWAVSDGVATVQPDFVVLTGDVTDGTNGLLYSGANDAEWQLYRSIVDPAGLNDPDYFFDLPGNHDAYGDDGLALYRKYSVQGSATGRTQAEWRLDRPWGSTCFVAVATAQEEGKGWPADPTLLSPAELAETETFLAGNPDCRVTLAFGHHDAREVGGGDGFRALCQAHGIGHYVHGHEHDYQASYDGLSPLVLRTDSLGQGGDHQLTVLAVDHDTVSWESVGANDPWPLIVVTAPARGRFQTGSSWGNPEYLDLPYAPPVPRACEQAPVRVLIFDPQAIASAAFRLDDGPWHDLTQRQDVPAAWRGRFDATALAAGWHTLTVKAAGSKERAFDVQVRLVDAPCDVGDEDPDGGSVVEPEPEVPPEPVVEVVAEPVVEVVPETSPEASVEASVEVVDEVAADAVGPEDPGLPGVDAGSDGAGAPEAAGDDHAAPGKDVAVHPAADASADTSADGHLGTQPRPDDDADGSRSSCAVGARARSPRGVWLLLSVVSGGLVVVRRVRRRSASDAGSR